MSGEYAFAESAFEISEQACALTVRVLSALRSRLGVNIQLRGRKDVLESGHIFLFNHFARFETFIPQYLMYQETGAYCRSVAAREFFVKDDVFSNYLMDLGAVPNDYPRLLPFLAEEVLRGRKVIVFPEGGMVKDRRVLDEAGAYSIYSSSARERRKHHTGAAVLALTLEAFKAGILEIHKAGDTPTLQRWAGILGMDGTDDLLASVRRPSLVVPANITFYPIRVGDNILRKGVDFFAKGLSEKLSEELLIEGNILLKNTDMDIRLCEPEDPGKVLNWWDRKLLAKLVRRAESLDQLFDLEGGARRLDEKFIARKLGREFLGLRDAYMRSMYSGVTVNLSHLASRILCSFVDEGRTEVDYETFHRTLYLALKYAQEEPSIHLHRSLMVPTGYDGVFDGRSPGLEQFLKTATESGLVKRGSEGYLFLPNLLEEHSFHEVRLENFILVYANEVAPVAAARRAVQRAIKDALSRDDVALAHLLFDDEMTAFAWNKRYFSLAQYRDINDQETATANAEPYLFLPEKPKGLGIVMVHGFLASPAELRGFAEKLKAEGYPVIGVRLKGHGTSPWDLRGRSWKDWMDSVRRGYRIMQAFADRICLVGFSTGGALSLILAAERPDRLAGVAAVSAPLKFRNRNLIFVPLIHGANKLVRWVSSFEGVMPFRANISEHPDINYRNMPVRGLYELRLMADELKRRLKDVQCPVTIVQSTGDQVVNPRSGERIRRRLGSAEKTLHMIASDHHGILNEDIGGSQELVAAFIRSLTPTVPAPAPRIVIGADAFLPEADPVHAWLPYYPQGLDWAEPIGERTVHSLLDESVRLFAARPCLDFLGKGYTYGQVGELVDRAARGFQDLGVGKGTRVGLCLPNTPYFVICYYAILKAGGTVVNYNPLYAERELIGQIEESGTDIMVTLDLRQIYPKVARLLERTGLKRVIVCSMSGILPAVKGLLFSVLRRSEIASIPEDARLTIFEELTANDGDAKRVEIDPGQDLAVLQFTGGTTGTPKAAMLTHANLAANAEQVRLWYPAMEQGRERILAALPLFHVFAMTTVMNLGIASGAELILLPRFEIDQVLKTIDADKPTLFPGVPTIFTAINEHRDLDDYDLSSIKYCISGGAPLHMDTKDRFEQLTGCVLVEGYGLSEASPVVACNPVDGTRKVGSIGIPLPQTVVEIHSLEDRDMPVPIGENGEICVIGPQVMAGYWNREEETNEAVHDGCLHTGDIGYMDGEGYIFVIDRMGELILCGGYNVYPRIVEEAISLHPAVAEVAVIGVPDAYRGESPKAFVKVREGESLSARALLEFLDDKLSPIERPEVIEFRDELPKTLIGKPDKKALARESGSNDSAEMPKTTPKKTSLAS